MSCSKAVSTIFMLLGLSVTTELRCAVPLIAEAAKYVILLNNLSIYKIIINMKACW